MHPKQASECTAKRSENSTIWIENSRIMAICAVVVLHVAASVLKELPVGDGGWWVAAVFDAYTRWAVPVFVMISGALLLGPDKREGLGVFYGKRLARIGAPLLFWSAFYLLWVVVKGYAGGAPVGLSELGRRVVTGLPYYHMWFLFMIAGLYAFVPFFRIVTTHATVSELKVLVCSTFVPAALNAIADKAAQDSFTPFFVSFVPYIPYFLLGHLIRTGGFAPPKRLAWGVFAGSGALAVAGCYAVAAGHGLEAGKYFFNNLSVTVIPMSVSLMCILRSWDRPVLGGALTGRMADLVFGVYLVHPVFIDAIKFLGLFAPTANQLVFIPATSAAVLSLSVAAAYCIGRLRGLRKVL